MLERLSYGAGGNRNTEICPRRPPGPHLPMKSGLCVRRVRLRPSSGVPFVTPVVTREGGLFGDAEDGV